MSTRLVTVLLLASCGGLFWYGDSDNISAKRRFVGAPRIVLWAWERPEDLSFLDSRRVGVAYLAGTLILTEDQVKTYPRLQPLQVPAGTWMLAVVRLESSADPRPSLSPEQSFEAAQEIVRLVRSPGLAGVQIDFDALASEKAFYRDLLTRLRPLLREDAILSITALASWCLGDPWIADLPVDEAVPMLFRMGPEGASIRSRLDAGNDFTVETARSSYGISTDESWPELLSHRLSLDS